MKKSSKIIIGLSIMASSLAMSQMCFAKSPIVGPAVFKAIFTPSSDDTRAECLKTLPPLSYRYELDPKIMKATLTSQSNEYGPMNRDAFISLGKDKGVFIDSVLRLTPGLNPIHFAANVNAGDESFSGSGWFYPSDDSTTDRSTPCNFTVSFKRV